MIFLTDYRTASTEYTELIEDGPYPQRVHWFPETFKNVKTGLVYPPHKMADKLLSPEFIEDVKSRPGKTAFILASGNSAFNGTATKEQNHRLWYEYKVLPLSLTQIFAGRIAQQFNAQDLVITDASACASSLKVMMDVQSLVMVHGFSRVIVLSVEDTIACKTLQFFGETGASLTLKHEQETAAKPSAFDSVNFGFNIGQGSVLAVFETDHFAKQASAKLVSAYSAAESSTNAIGQREDGEGFKKAIMGAIESRQVDRNKIAVVKTHGTGTRSNNAAERSALDSTLSDQYVATSFKPAIGHTMGASGLLETCLLLDALKQTGKVPAIKNRTEHDPVFLSEDTKPRSGYILSLAAGMGNIYSAAIFDPKV